MESRAIWKPLEESVRKQCDEDVGRIPNRDSHFFRINKMQVERTPTKSDPPIHVCNNGRVVLNSELGEYALYTGPDLVDGPAPFADFMKLYVGPPVAHLWMNAMGDIAFTDEHENFEACNLTSHSPEPRTWILLATGAVGILGMMRRRMAAGRWE